MFPHDMRKRDFQKIYRVDKNIYTWNHRHTTQHLLSFLCVPFGFPGNCSYIYRVNEGRAHKISKGYDKAGS